MMMKRIVTLLLAMALLLALCACGLGNSSSASKPAESEKTESAAPAQETATSDDPYANVEHKIIRFSSVDTTANYKDPGFSNTVSDIFMRDEIYARTQGRYKLEIYPDGQLASADSEALAGLKSGNFEITTLSNGSMGAFTNAYAELSVPFFYAGNDELRATLDGPIGADMKANAEADMGVKIML